MRAAAEAAPTSGSASSSRSARSSLPAQRRFGPLVLEVVVPQLVRPPPGVPPRVVDGGEEGVERAVVGRVQRLRGGAVQPTREGDAPSPLVHDLLLPHSDDDQRRVARLVHILEPTHAERHRL
eukprot:CAMPEP_0185440914 /NCGR_PEP_ID=MMETSP1365-20130426/41181_1 /TAXON_ID=38817 /ORGANISM="Gephyrocapsa oceanica, Strain RCC1303" /LENGTH=122 /DNA_ID=CAMNT_0028046351 /DNA_START=94 /DNA_END=460 /DNA_ORIENTATION=+